MSLILKRRSVRRFDRKAVSGDIIKAIVKAGQRAPTSCGTQFYSFILVNDTRERREILNLVTENRVLQSAPIWIFVCSDVARPLKMFKSLRMDCYFSAEKSTVRPRWNTNVVMHKNRYRMPAKGRLLWNYRRSNKTLVNMGYFSQGVGSLAEHWQRKFASKEMMLREKKLRKELRKIGFLPNRL
ncbi:MAG: nitroreductase family protein [Candidatus Bathyarchaeota archaeon]|nr:nitroreductase family protein [Candidatus Bathyarchaeota archaeon]